MKKNQKDALHQNHKKTKIGQLLGLSLLMGTVLLGVSACGGTIAAKPSAENGEKESVAKYQKISPEAAKKKMDAGGVIVLDVRTQEEYDGGHIENAVLLPNTDIKDKAAEVLPDKNAVILVYCRSGNRSRSASQDLIDMGYTQVYDFGGIIDWPY